MTLFLYPPQTALKRLIPKSRIYNGANASTALRDRFVEQVDQIIWAHKLAPETLNLPPTDAVPEIQVFRLMLRGDALHDDILRAIDRAVPFPLMFELHGPDRIQPAAAYKRPSAAEGGKWVLSDPLRGDWVAADTARVPLPVAVSMAALYDGMLGTLIPNAALPGEGVEARLARASAIRAQEREIARLQSRLRRENQFNIKVTLHGQLAEAQATFDHLKAPGSGKGTL